MTERVINNQGVKILLERMDSNPEEFTRGSPSGLYPTKWKWVTEAVYERINRKIHGTPTTLGEYTPLPYLSDEEVDALYEKLRLLHADLFTKQVMETLLLDKTEEETYRELSHTLSMGRGMARNGTAVHAHQTYSDAYATAIQQKAFETAVKKYTGTP